MKTLAGCISILLLATIAGAIPQLINYQGSLARSNGSPLDTTVAMTFKLWSAASAGTLYWTETDAAMPVANGLFNVSLGQTTALADSILNHAQLWLGVTVGTDAEMTPRVQLKSVPFSYRVGTLDGATAGSVGGDLYLSGRAALGANAIGGANSFAAGYLNFANGDQSSVSGGELNFATGVGSHVGGGQYNHARGDYSIVGGGGGMFAYDSNSAIGAYSVVAGGYDNAAAGLAATLSGGIINTASGQYATVSGGDLNTSAGPAATVSGGYDNTVSGNSAAISGGVFNSASGDYAAIGGGNANLVSGWYSTISGGYDNTVGANFATVPGGSNCVANGDYSFVAGHNAKTNSNASGSFVWGDNSTNDTMVVGTANRVVFRAANGYRLYTAADLSTGVSMGAGDGAWSSISDSTKKENIRRVNTAEVLAKVSQLPISEWNYKTQDDKQRHIGPMAQDFYNAFRLGDSDTTISTIDPDGVALAAIQELTKENHKLAEQVQQLVARVQSLEANKQESARVEQKGK